MSFSKIPIPVITVVSELLAIFHTHKQLTTLFLENGAPEEIPDGNKEDRCNVWLRRCNANLEIDPLNTLGKALEHVMDIDCEYDDREKQDAFDYQRKRINNILSKHGLTYHSGGQILGAISSLSTKKLNNILKNKNLAGIEQEFKKALLTVESDPPAGLTAACSIVESLCKIYIEDNGLTLPSEQTIRPLWKIVGNHLGFRPELVDDDLKKILSGLYTTVEGLGSLRSHAGSAHGRGRKSYKIKPRHAHLAIHAAHTLCIFVIETWLDKTATGLRDKPIIVYNIL